MPKTGEKSFMNSMILVSFKNSEKEQMRKSLVHFKY